MSPRRSGNCTARHGTYDEWATYLNLWSRGEPADGSGLAPLHAEDFQGETWNRLTKRLLGAVNRRLESWHTALVRATDAGDATATNESEHERALGQARDALRPIHALAEDERLPQDLREQLTKLIDDNLRQIPSHKPIVQH